MTGPVTDVVLREPEPEARPEPPASRVFGLSRSSCSFSVQSNIANP